MISRRIVCWLAIVGFVCGGATACTTTAPAASTTPAATLDPTGVGQGGSWGPLAVVDERVTGSADARGGAGTLQIGADCVTLDLNEVDRAITLVWRGAEVAWDSSAREIVFTDPQEGQVRLSDGDTIAVGGTDFTNPNPTWFAQPAPSCPAEMFTVHDIIR